jgi:hypothetical protein
MTPLYLRVFRQLRLLAWMHRLANIQHKTSLIKSLILATTGMIRPRFIYKSATEVIKAQRLGISSR